MGFDNHVTAVIASRGVPFCATCGYPLGRSLDWTWRHLDDDLSLSWTPDVYQNGTRGASGSSGATQTHPMEEAAKRRVQGLYKFTVGNLGGMTQGDEQGISE